MADELFAAFVVDQVTSGTLVPDVADSYVSHVLSHLENHLPRDVDVRRLARTPFLRDTMIGLRRHHSATHPRVDRRKIPLYLSVCIEVLKDIALCGAPPRFRCALAAALALAYGKSLRPSEYLVVRRQLRQGPKHALMDEHTAFVFEEKIFSATRPDQFPSGKPPSHFLFRVGFHAGESGTKDDQYKERPDRVLAAPSEPHRFNPVSYLLEYFTQYPPPFGGPLFLSEHGPLSDTHLDAALKRTAKRLNLDARRLRPQSVRGGALQTADAVGASEALCMSLGPWRSKKGIQAYRAAPLLAPATVTANITNDPTPIPLAHVQHFFPDPSQSPVGWGDDSGDDIR